MRILLVEDDVKISKPLKKGLEQEAFAIDVASDGQEGLDLASTESYDLIILDLMLPKISGIDVCKKLRKEGKNTPVLMLTALSTLENKVDGLNCGADDYLTKPFAFEELLARIKALLRRPISLNGTELQCGDLLLDPQHFSVSREGNPIELSKTEFSLLEYLLLNKNKTISKETLIEHVWNYDSDILPNTVEVYIGYLRSKIDKPYKTELLKTVRGFGYKMEDPRV